MFCRHAGPGDSFTLMYALMHWYGREPRVVLKETLAWDPMLGVLLTRLPSRFISPRPAAGRDVEAEVGELARNLDENDAFVIFPEGGNFTPARRERAIARLNRLGLHRMAERAEEMINVLAPRPGGVIAALDAAPEADVLLVAHTGLDHVVSLADVWHSLPMDKRLLMGWWRIPREEIPEDREAADRVALRVVEPRRRAGSTSTGRSTCRGPEAAGGADGWKRRTARRTEVRRAVRRGCQVRTSRGP